MPLLFGNVGEAGLGVRDSRSNKWIPDIAIRDNERRAVPIVRRVRRAATQGPVAGQVEKKVGGITFAWRLGGITAGRNIRIDPTDSSSVDGKCCTEC